MGDSRGEEEPALQDQANTPVIHGQEARVFHETRPLASSSSLLTVSLLIAVSLTKLHFAVTLQ